MSSREAARRLRRRRRPCRATGQEPAWKTSSAHSSHILGPETMAGFELSRRTGPASATPGPGTTGLLLFPCRNDLAQVIRRAFDALQMRILQAVVVVHRHGPISALVFQQQPDWRLVALRRGDRIRQHVPRIVPAVHRDQGGAGADPSLERGPFQRTSLIWPSLFKVRPI